MKYIKINIGQQLQFNKRVTAYHATNPVPIEEPKNLCVLPITVLQIEGINDMMPQLQHLPRIDESEITWIEYDEII